MKVLAFRPRRPLRSRARGDEATGDSSRFEGEGRRGRRGDSAGDPRKRGALPLSDAGRPERRAGRTEPFDYRAERCPRPMGDSDAGRVIVRTRTTRRETRRREAV